MRFFTRVKSFKSPPYSISHNSPVNVYFLLLILEMEDSREILTNNQDDNEVETHGRRHTPVEGIHWDPTEVK